MRYLEHISCSSLAKDRDWSWFRGQQLGDILPAISVIAGRVVKKEKQVIIIVMIVIVINLCQVLTT